MAETIWNTVVMVFHFIMKNIVIINILLSLIIVFFERRSPQAVWTWLLLLYFIPIVGFILYALSQDRNIVKAGRHPAADGGHPIFLARHENRE